MSHFSSGLQFSDFQFYFEAWISLWIDHLQMQEERVNSLAAGVFDHDYFPVGSSSSSSCLYGKANHHHQPSQGGPELNTQTVIRGGILSSILRLQLSDLILTLSEGTAASSSERITTVGVMSWDYPASKISPAALRKSVYPRLNRDWTITCEWAAQWLRCITHSCSLQVRLLTSHSHSAFLYDLQFSHLAN